MGTSTDTISVMDQLVSDMLRDERIISSSERELITSLLDNSAHNATGNADLDAAVSRRLVAATVGSMGGRIVNALADELVRQLLGRQVGGDDRPHPHRAPQVSPSNPGNTGGQVSPSNPGNLAPQVSPVNPGNTGGQVSPSNPGNLAPQVSPSNPGNSPGAQVSPWNPGNNMAPQVSPSNPGNSPGAQVSPSNPGNLGPDAPPNAMMMNPPSGNVPPPATPPGPQAMPDTHGKPSAESKPVPGVTGKAKS